MTKGYQIDSLLLWNMVRLAGLEPVTPTMSRWCSNQLSYSRIDGKHSIGKNSAMQYAFS